MKKDKIEKLSYSLFTGEERFWLYIEALYRSDEDEANRLYESCPQAIYSMNQVAFVDRCRASKELVDTLSFALASRMAELRMIEAFREALPCLSNIYIREGIRLPQGPRGRLQTRLGSRRQDRRSAGVERVGRRR